MKKITLCVYGILFATVVALIACSSETVKEPKKIKEETTDNWKLRDEFVKDGETLLTVALDPALEAGKPYGNLFHFTALFETFKGKDLAIYAYHKETGEKVTTVSPQTIIEPSSGYSTLERFTATFEVPISGLWRYEVVLDDEFYADVVLLVKE